jgi:predicted ester cyclase
MKPGLTRPPFYINLKLARGSPGGELMGVAATDKPIDVSAIVVFRIEGDKVAEFWGVFDRMGMLQQITAGAGTG